MPRGAGVGVQVRRRGSFVVGNRASTMVRPGVGGRMPMQNSTDCVTWIDFFLFGQEMAKYRSGDAVTGYVRFSILKQGLQCQGESKISDNNHIYEAFIINNLPHLGRNWSYSFGGFSVGYTD